MVAAQSHLPAFANYYSRLESQLSWLEPLIGIKPTFTQTNLLLVSPMRDSRKIEDRQGIFGR
jgi:hypothetical protein